MTHTTEQGGSELPKDYTISDLERIAKEYAAGIPEMENAAFQFRLEHTLVSNLSGRSYIDFTYYLEARFSFEAIDTWYDRMRGAEGIDICVIYFDDRIVFLSWKKSTASKILQDFYTLCSIVKG